MTELLGLDFYMFETTLDDQTLYSPQLLQRNDISAVASQTALDLDELNCSTWFNAEGSGG